MGNRKGNPQHRALSAREEIFCQAYCTIGSPTFSNATKSKEKAKYSDKKRAAPIFKKAHIKARIDEIMSELVVKLGLTPEKVLMGILHDQECARAAEQWSVSNACSRLLGETYAMFSEKLFILAKVKTEPPRELTTDEIDASIAGAKAYKLRLAGAMSDDGVMAQPRAGRDEARAKPVKFIPSIDVTPEPIEVPEDIPVKAMNDLVKEQETLEHEPASNYDEMLDKMCGSPRANPTHSLSSYDQRT